MGIQTAGSTLLIPKPAIIRSELTSLQFGNSYCVVEAGEINKKESRGAQSRIIPVSLTNLNSIIQYQEQWWCNRYSDYERTTRG